MGSDVTLVLKANNSDYVNKMKEAATAEQKVYDIAEKGTRKEKGLIADLEKSMQSLQEKRRNAFRIEDIEKYNKKLAEAKLHLQEYEQAGLKVEKQSESLTQSIGKWVMGLGIAVTVLAKLKDAFLKTQQGMIIFTQAMAGIDQVLSNVVNGTGNWNKGVAEAMILAKQMALLQLEDKRNSVERNRLMREYNELYTEGIDASNSAVEKITKLTAAKSKYIQATKGEINDMIAQLDIAKKQLALDPTNLDFQSKVIDYTNKIEDLFGQMAQGTRRLTRQITAEEQQIWTGTLDAFKTFDQELQKEIDDRIKEVDDKRIAAQIKFQELSLKLLDDYDKSNIESLTGVDKLKAIRDFGLKQLAEFRKQLAALGIVTVEQDAIFEALGKNIWKQFYKGVKSEAKLTPEQIKSVSKALSEGYIITERDQENIVTKIKGAFTKIKNELRPSKIRSSETLDEEPLSAWSLLGIDPESEEGQKQVDAIKEMASTIMNTIDEVYQKRVEETQRRRELLDNQISEIQSELQTEAELQKAGFANNVDLKRKELAELKKQRDEALKKEEAALKQQQSFDRTSQAISLATSAANILKSFTKMGPVGLILAVGAIAGLYKLFADAKVKSLEATKYAKGGWTGDGSQRDSTGERVAGVVHEKEFVVRRGPANKFRDVLEAINRDDKRMIFNSFNKISPDLLGGTTVNNVIVQNEGPNKRLDKVNEQLTKLNKTRVREEVYQSGRETIIRKGQSTRVIKR